MKVQPIARRFYGGTMGGNVGLGAMPAVLLNGSQPSPNCIYADSNCPWPNPTITPGYDNSINYQNPSNASDFTVVFMQAMGGQVTDAYSDVNGNLIITPVGSFDPSGSNGWIQIDPQGHLLQFFPGVPPPRGGLSVTPAQAQGYSQLVQKLIAHQIQFNAPLILSVGAFVPGTPGATIATQTAAGGAGASTAGGSGGGTTTIYNTYTYTDPQTGATQTAAVSAPAAGASSSFDPMAWIQQNPLIAAGAGVALLLVLMK